MLRALTILNIGAELITRRIFYHLQSKNSHGVSISFSSYTLGKTTTSDEGEYKITGKNSELLSTRESTKLDSTLNVLWYSQPTNYKSGFQ